MIKSIYTTIFKTLGTMTSTAKDSFIEGYNNPYKPAEPSASTFQVDDNEPIKSTYIRDVSWHNKESLIALLFSP